MRSDYLFLGQLWTKRSLLMHSVIKYRFEPFLQIFRHHLSSCLFFTQKSSKPRKAIFDVPEIKSCSFGLSLAWKESF